jgi:hypothetical protein
MAGWLAGNKGTAQRLNDNSFFTLTYASIAANATAGTTTELVAITTASVTMRNGRAYRMTFKGLVQSSIAADTVTVRIRKTNISGTVYLDSMRIYIPVAAANAPIYFSNICTNTSGADVTAVLVGTYIRASGTGNVLVAASATHVAFVHVEDVGLATDYSGATAIT